MLNRLEIYFSNHSKLHKRIRGFYDKYGFPISKLIHSKYVADFIYFIMKPLEWLFLIVLYLVDREPENRIAVQYMGESFESDKRR